MRTTNGHKTAPINEPGSTMGVTPGDADFAPLDFWQAILPARTYDVQPPDGHHGYYPASLPDGRQLALPIRERDQGKEALASLIINQASFTVLDALATELAKKIAPLDPDIIVGLPTLGLPLAQETARRLGHQRFVALSFSRKFWYDDALSVPVRSITSPGQKKWLFADPRMLPLMASKSIVLIDDVISSGKSIAAALELLAKCGVTPNAIGAAMLQSDSWVQTLGGIDTGLPEKVFGVFKTPLLTKLSGGGWQAAL